MHVILFLVLGKCKSSWKSFCQTLAVSSRQAKYDHNFSIAVKLCNIYNVLIDNDIGVFCSYTVVFFQQILMTYGYFLKIAN